MKTLLLFACCFIFLTSGAQKFNLTPRLNMSTAKGEQVGKFKNAYGLGMGAEMRLFNSSLKLMLNADAGINGMKSMPYEFEFQNSITKTEINYNSSIVELTSGLRYIFNENKRIQPYAGMGFGMLRYSTGYQIEDPEHPDGCHALESENILSDAAFIGRMEAGFRYATSWEVQLNDVLIDVGVSYKRGTSAKYMRLSKNDDQQGVDYSVKFQNRNNEIHEHSIGKIYNTAVNQLAFHAGVVIPLGR